MEATVTAPPVPEAPELQLGTARSGLPVLRLGGRYLHSPYDPRREAEGWARGLLSEQADDGDEGELLWVVFGTGLGYHLRALTELGGGRIIALEPDARVTRLDERQRLLPGTVEVYLDGAELLRAFRTHYPQAGRTRVVSLPAYRELFPEQFAEITRQLAAAQREIKADSLTYVTYGGGWLLQSLGNLPALLAGRPLAELQGAGRGRAAVVVSPGPSLERNIAVLAANRERFLVLAPSQSLRALMAAGIEPDLVVVVDSQNLTYHFADCPPRFYRRLVLAAKCHPRVVALPAEQRYFFHLPYNSLAADFFTWATGSPCSLAAGYSVSNSAFSLGCLLGCDPVVLVGQDLAFTGGRVYASQAVDGSARIAVDESRGTVRYTDFTSKLRLVDDDDRQAAARRLAQAQTLVWLKGVNGERLPTSMAMAAMHSWFERRAQALAGKRRLVNATEGGAFIAGMEHLALAELAAAIEPQPPWQPPPAEARTYDRRRLRRGLQELAGRCGELARLAARCLELARRLQGRAAPRPEQLAKLQVQERRLLKALGRLSAVDALVQNHMREFRRRCRAGGDDLATNLEASGLLYEGVGQAAELLRERVQQTIAQGEW